MSLPGPNGGRVVLPAPPPARMDVVCTDFDIRLERAHNGAGQAVVVVKLAPAGLPFQLVCPVPALQWAKLLGGIAQDAETV